MVENEYLKLTHLGLAVNTSKIFTNIIKIIKKKKQAANIVRMDEKT